MMESEDWEISSDELNDSELNSPYEDDDNDDDEDYCFTSISTSKLQFRKDVSKAKWNEEIGMAEVVEKKGRLWTTSGVVRNGKICCSIEETLFLAEVGALILLNDDDTPLSLVDAYERVARGKYGCGWENFEVYKHLKALGYIVGRHAIPWTMKGVKSYGDSISVQDTSERNAIIDSELECHSVIEQFKSMQIDEARPLFDVYLPNSRFRKSDPGNPSFVLCSTRGNPPSKQEIEALETRCNGISLKFCHVEHGRVSYFCFNKVDLLVLP